MKKEYGNIIGIGLVVSIAVGLLFGWLRYWLGCFILIQGTLAGLGIAWCMRTRNHSVKQPVSHPGFGAGLGIAGALFLTFMGAQTVGFGLAQPWFEPVGWLGRILEGKTVEPVFGVASTAGVHRGFALQLSGGWWILFNGIDWAIMFFFLLAMPWSDAGERRELKSKGGV